MQTITKIAGADGRHHLREYALEPIEENGSRLLHSFCSLRRKRPLPRVGIHYGETVYRDGDYYGREVNLAARVAARAAGGETLVTRPVVDHAGSHLEFEPIGEVRLKGFREPTELFLARSEE